MRLGLIGFMCDKHFAFRDQSSSSSTIWSHSIVTKHCCDSVSNYGKSSLAAELILAKLQMLHIQKCSIAISNSVVFC